MHKVSFSKVKEAFRERNPKGYNSMPLGSINHSIVQHPSFAYMVGNDYYFVVGNTTSTTCRYSIKVLNESGRVKTLGKTGEYISIHAALSALKVHLGQA